MRQISTSDAPQPVAAYAQAVVAGDTVYLSGIVGLEPASGRMVDGGLEAQTRQAFANARAVLAAAGLSETNVAKVTIYLTDMAAFATVNAEYARFVGGHRPARTTVGVASLPLGALVEIDVVATKL